MEHKKWNLDLAGAWELLMEDGTVLPGKLPGCSYLTLLDNKRIEDPFRGCNEKAASELAKQKYCYRREFSLSEAKLDGTQIELVLSGVDTLAAIFVNGKLAGRTENAFQTYRFGVAELLHQGINELRIDFDAPHSLLAAKQEKRPLAGMDIGVPGVSYIRKPQYHFGWDWGPSLPPAGVGGRIALEGYSLARLDRFTVSQKHENGEVSLIASATCIRLEEGTPLKLIWSVIGPEGEALCQKADFSGDRAESMIRIPNPKLWWCNGMGEQPLYRITAQLQTAAGECLDTRDCRVGLRTVELNRAADQWGENFQFRVNGHPIFAKGANWIPADSFVERVTGETLEFYIRSAKEANMNMLRVWGGGFYESDKFYELCDQYGILVWQDFAFACRAYPLDDPSFLENVKEEVTDQVLRLQHHASLALWCGNNELQLEELLWANDKALREAIHVFFFETLPEWIRELDPVTAYWYGSPSDKTPGKRANTMNCGDTHLWQIWHGLMPITAFRRYPTRFCSEFGLEALPSKAAISAFTDAETAALQSPDMMNHQKSARGNEKLLYYVTSRHPRPMDLDGTIYLTQIMQAEGVRSAVEFWHKNKGCCNGALYWQYNDCWPAISWSGIDYLGQYKALQYWAKSFCAPVSIVPEQKGNWVQIQLINDRKEPWQGNLQWQAVSLAGNVVSSGTADVSVEATGVSDVISLNLREVLSGRKRNAVVLCLSALEEGRVIAQRNLPLAKEKRMRFAKPVIDMQLELEGTKGRLTLKCDSFAHYVFLSTDGMPLNFSDNFFDLRKGEKKTVHFLLPEGMDAAEVERRLQVRSYGDIPMVHTPVKDGWMRLRMRFSWKGIRGWLMTQI